MNLLSQNFSIFVKVFKKILGQDLACEKGEQVNNNGLGSKDICKGERAL